MRPVRHADSNFVYRGPTADIGDLHVTLVPGPNGTVVEVVYELDDADRALIAVGARIELGVYSQPIPPISMRVLAPGECEPIGDHGWKIIPELDDPERRP